MGQPAEILAEFISRDDVLGDRYVVEEQIAGGAYGAIYLAFDREGREKVAVKALPPQGEGSSDTAIGRFERELKVVRNLKHPNIVEVRDYGETDEAILYMVMEYIQGETLDDRVEREGALPVDETLSITRQMASALSTAHDLGVIHRDLKPANIMLERGMTGPQVKILDFGMAKLVAKLGEESIVALTREGVAVGTPRYIAPEQARGSDRIGPWTDIYALGLLLYEMTTGVKAVQHDSVESAVAEHVDPEPLEMRHLEDAPEPIQELVRRLTVKDLDARIARADEVIDEIEAMEETPLGAELRGKAPDGAPTGPASGGPPGEAPGKSVDASPAIDETLQGVGGRASSPPETADPPERPSPPEAAETPPDGEEGEGEDLELDWEHYKEHAPAEYDPESSRWERTGTFAGLSGTARLLGWGVLVLATTFGALLVLGAQFSAFAPLHRAIFGLAPAVIALFSVAGIPARFRARHFCRNAVAANLVGIIVAHLVGPARLVQGLWNEPAWFVQFLQDVPGGPAVIDGVAWVGRSYATLLAGIFDVGASGMGSPPLP